MADLVKHLKTSIARTAALQKVVDAASKFLHGEIGIRALDATLDALTYDSVQREHKPGCEALGGYGHGVGPCTCGAG